MEEREEDEIQSHFLQIHLARLSMARLLGVLDRWIRVRVEKATEEELFIAESDLWRASRADGEDRLSLGSRRVRLVSHPLYKILLSERLKRDRGLEFLEPARYFNPLHLLSNKEIQDYLIWKGEIHGTLQEWQKEKKRSLPILKPNEGRASQGASDNREGSVNGGSNNKDPLPNISSSKGEKRAYSPGAGKKKEKSS